MGIVLEHLFRDVTCHVADYFIARAALRQISNERMACVMEASINARPFPGVTPSGLQ
jgi:hypothetical protein